ncbi:MAG: hypothetical protein JOY82_07590 [Streptosporangiaceae bacterium]|nr:hypothetical protein [Streptosporangiaceae bacterium]MBV9854376.1 hypothetical protein [Streptosporangiaceae bacterium]
MRSENQIIIPNERWSLPSGRSGAPFERAGTFAGPLVTRKILPPSRVPGANLPAGYLGD